MTVESNTLYLRLGFPRRDAIWRVDSGVFLRCANPSDAVGLAQYHAHNEAHLRKWDVSWNAGRTLPDWHAARLTALWAHEGIDPSSREDAHGRAVARPGNLAAGSPDPSLWIGILITARGDAADVATHPDAAPMVNPTIMGLIEIRALQGAVARGAQELMLSYSLGERFEGRGWMRAALTALLGHLREASETDLNLLAQVRQDNHRSAALLRHLGFGDEGRDPEFPVLNVQGRWLVHHRHRLELRRTGF